MSSIDIFTDGACRGNPGPGGWGALLRYQNHEKRISGSEIHTTNNRMELTAVIMAISTIKKSLPISVTTDSKYVRDGITKWVPQWKKRHWKTSENKPVKNQDLWQSLDKLVQCHTIEWHWIKGHSGHPENDIADQLANEAIDQLLREA